MGSGNSHAYQPRDLTGKVVVITGANTGIGLETAIQLAKIHAHVIVAVRSDQKGVETVKKIREQYAQANAEYMILELNSLDSVRTFVDNFKAKNLPLHILINNAGIMNTPYGVTVDGYEQQFGVNHLAHFLLTLSLLDVIKDSAPSKIINLSSAAHNFGNTDYSGIDQTPKNYSGWTSYGSSKLANVLFTNALARRLQGTNVTVNAVHPGLVRNTDLVRTLSTSSGLYDSILSFITRIGNSMSWTSKSVEDGAKTTLVVAADPVSDSVTGKYWADLKIQSSSRISLNVDEQEKLWVKSLKWVGIEDPTNNQ